LKEIFPKAGSKKLRSWRERRGDSGNFDPDEMRGKWR